MRHTIPFILLFPTRYCHFLRTVMVQRCYPACKLTAWQSFVNPWRQKILRTETRTVIFRAGNLSFMCPSPPLASQSPQRWCGCGEERSDMHSGFVFQLNNLDIWENYNILKGFLDYFTIFAPVREVSLLLYLSLLLLVANKAALCPRGRCHLSVSRLTVVQTSLKTFWKKTVSASA